MAAPNVQVMALLIQTGGQLLSQVITNEQMKARVKSLAAEQAKETPAISFPEAPAPIIQIVTSRPDLLDQPLDFQPFEAKTKYPEPPPDMTITPKTDVPVAEVKAKSIASGCIPCSLGHFSTCSGLLNEAMRFALKEGMSGEVNDRVNMCVDELNALERVDLRPEMTTELTGWEKDLAVKTLNTSRAIRHNLEGLQSVEDLEKTAAMTQGNRKEIGREWFKHKVDAIPEEKMSAEKKQKAMEELDRLESKA